MADEIEIQEEDDSEVKIAQSPIVTKITDVESSPRQMDFGEAMKKIVLGKKVTKLEWKDDKIYGIIDETILKLHKADGKLYQWILNDGDLSGEDYVEV